MENLGRPLYYEESDLKRSLESDLDISHFQVATENIKLRSPMLLPFGVIESRPSGCVYAEGVCNGFDTAGFGEGATLPLPLFTDDSGRNISRNINLLMEAASLGKTANQAISRIHNYTFTDGRYPTARLAAEMAIIDMVARSENQSVINLLDLNHSYGIQYGHSIGVASLEEILSEADNAALAGAEKIKLKISPVTHDLVVYSLRKLQQKYPDLSFMVDANGTYDPLNHDHIEDLRELDSLGLMLIEEPASRVGEYKGIEAVRALRNKIKEFKTPICLDDCIYDENIAKSVVDENLAEVISIKPGRIGSIIKSLVLIDWITETFKHQVMTGGMLEATPGRAMTTVIAAYCYEKGSNIPGDLSLAQDRLSGDLVPEDRQLRLGKYGGIALPLKPGWGY